MIDPASRKVIRSGRVRELLNLGEEALRRRRREAGFPKTLTMPGRPRWYEDEILAWRDGRDRGEVAAGAFLAGGPDLAGLSLEEQYAAALAHYRERAALARKEGRPDREQVDLWAVRALEFVDASIMAAARRLVRYSALAEGGA